MTGIFLGLGSNLGEREDNLRRAIDSLAPEIRVTKKSSLYQTTPMYLTNQPEFLNMVVKAETDLSPVDVFKKIKRIEKEIGRVESERFGPRIIDIDLLFYRNEQVQMKELMIPHPSIPERAFVLEPMNDLAPDFVHPTFGVRIAELLAKLGDTSKDVKKI